MHWHGDCVSVSSCWELPKPQELGVWAPFSNEIGRFHWLNDQLENWSHFGLTVRATVETRSRSSESWGSVTPTTPSLDIISVCSQSFSRVLQRKTLIASPKQIVKTQLKHVKTLLSALVMNHDELLLHPFEGVLFPCAKRSWEGWWRGHQTILHGEQKLGQVMGMGRWAKILGTKCDMIHNG